jgi:hypothetical protein
MSATASPAAASFPLVLAATADGEFRIALRCDFQGAAGGPLQASLFVSDGSLVNTRAVLLDLPRVFEENTDMYGAPPPARGDEWAALGRMVTHAEVQIERSAAGDVESVITKHLHGRRLVDVRLPSRCDTATLQPVPPETAYAWYRAMLEAREAELVATNSRLYDAEHPAPPPPPPLALEPPGQQRWRPSRRPLAQKVRGKRLQLAVPDDTSNLEL